MVETAILSHMGGFPSGQRGQTVNLLAMPSKVRILLRPLYVVRGDPQSGEISYYPHSPVSEANL